MRRPLLVPLSQNRDNGGNIAQENPVFFADRESMSDSTPTDVTMWLKKATDGDDSAVNHLMPLVYDELRALAESYLKHERAGHTLQATALVHDAYVRLIKQEDVEWKNRAHFFAVAAQAIRRILVDHARGRLRKKRGGDRQRVQLEDDVAVAETPDVDLLALDEAMEQLAKLNKRQAEIVELRFFGGLGVKEVAAYMGVSPRTVDGDWGMARAWLRRAMRKDEKS